MHFGLWKGVARMLLRAPSSVWTLRSWGMKRPQEMQREPSSKDSRGGRSQTCPRAASWRAAVWWSGHWFLKVWRREEKERIGVGSILFVWQGCSVVGLAGGRCYVAIIAFTCARFSSRKEHPDTTMIRSCCSQMVCLRIAWVESGNIDDVARHIGRQQYPEAFADRSIKT